MAVIREDVVSIGFDVENNPFQALIAGLEEIKSALGILEQAESKLKEIGKEAGLAGQEVESLTNSMRAPPSDELAAPMKEVAQATAQAAAEMTALNQQMGELGNQGMVTVIKPLPGEAEKSKKGFEDITGAAKELAGSITQGVIGAFSALSSTVLDLGKKAISTGAEFESSMSKAAATLGLTADEADYSNERYAKLAETAKEMGASTKFSAIESAEALNHLALAGYDVDKSCAALPTVLNLATAGGMELAEASDMVTDSMSALGVEANSENLTKFGDELAQTAIKSQTSVAELGEAIQTVGKTAKKLDVGSAELNTWLGILADGGVKGADGGAALRDVMLSLQSPTDAAAANMKSLGLSVNDAEGKMRPMNEILNDLNSSMDGMTDQQRKDALKTIFNTEDLDAVNTMLANSGDRYDELSGHINNSSGAMQNMADTMNDNLTGRITEFQNAAKGAGIAVYEALGNSNLKGIVEEAAGWIRELTQATEAGGLTGLTGALGGVFAKGLEMAASMLPQIVDMGVTMIESLADGITQNQGAISSSVTKGLSALVNGADKIIPKLLITGVEMIGSLLEGIAQELPALLKTGGKALQTMRQGLMKSLPSILQSGVSILKTLVAGLSQAAPSLIRTAVEMIGVLADGLISGIDLVINSAVTLVLALAQGLVENIPLIIDTAVNMVTGFVGALANNVGLVVDGALSLVVGLVDGIIQNLPAIAEGAVQMVFALVEGLIQAIPQLIAATPRLIAALLTAFMETDWLKLGTDIVGRISNGLINGIKGLFSKGKEAGKEVGEGVTAGLNESTEGIVTASDSTAATIEDEIKPDPLVMSDYGIEATENLAAGIDEGLPSVTDAAANVSMMATEAMQMEPAELEAKLTAIHGILSAKLLLMETLLSSSLDRMNASADAFSIKLTATFTGIKLYETGRNIMQGLNDGMSSMRGTLMETARGIANGISRTINASLDINSPSRVTEASGEYTALGLAKGMQNYDHKVKCSAQGISDTAARSIQPMKSRYSPEHTQASGSRTSHQTNTWNPVFNLTLNGASASDSNARKLKRSVKEAVNEAMSGMMRTNPQIQEV